MKQLALSVLILVAANSQAQNKLVKKNSSSEDSPGEKENMEQSKTAPSGKASLKLFSLNDWRKSFNTSFATILGGAGTTNEIGNYASFDPLNGSFNFKGSIPIGDVEKRVNFLSFAVKGGILSDNTAKLFKNTKVNTNTSLSGEYHFFMRVWDKSILVDKATEAVYNVKGAAIEKERLLKIAAVMDITKIEQKVMTFQTEQEAAVKLLSLQIKIIESAEKEVINLVKSYKVDAKEKEDCASNPETCHFQALSKAVTKLDNAQKSKDSLEKQLQKLDIVIDSTNLVIENWAKGLRLAEMQKINRERNKKLETIRDSALVAGYTMTWMTAIGSIGNSTVYRYNSQAIFGDQITEQTLHNNSVGLAINLFRKSATSKRSWLFNLGALYGLGNNADTLATTDINQEYSYKNIAGDSTRKITSKYSAYTDLIESRHAASVFASMYLIFGQRTSGLHLFSGFHKTNTHTGYINSGFGYIASFRSAKKDIPIFTTEFYVEFRDLFNSISTSKLHNRVDAGLKLTLPFNFF